MELTYIKVFVDYLDAIEPLGDAERGRLFTALLTYARSGEAPQLGGNERFLFPMMRAQIDRDVLSMDDLSKTRSESGKMGGRPKKQTEAKKPNAFLESKKSKDKDKEEDKDILPPISPNGDISPQRGEPTAEKRKRFVAPSVDEVRAYCKERGNSVDPQRFVDFYMANGWTQGRGKPIKDWRAAVRTWEVRDKQAAPVQRPVLTDDDYDLDKFF